MNVIEKLATGFGTGIMSMIPQTPGETARALTADREHTEMREDSSLDRLVASYRRNGLNPYSLAGSTSGLGSSASNVQSGVLGHSLQTLGYVLDIANLSLKNRQQTNELIGDILGFFKKKK